MSEIEKPDFVDNISPIFNPLEFNIQNLESENN